MELDVFLFFLIMYQIEMFEFHFKRLYLLSAIKRKIEIP